MKLILSLTAAAALAACSQTSQDDSAANVDAGGSASSTEEVLPADEGAGVSDTLGNQLNQLNEGDATADNADATNSQ